MSSGLVLLTQNHIVHLVIVFIRARTSRSVAALTSVHFAHVSGFLEQPVNASPEIATSSASGRRGRGRRRHHRATRRPAQSDISRQRTRPSRWRASFGLGGRRSPVSRVVVGS